jgi:multidrug efflux pump subunit AcrA (membrane-fusion protein)
MIPKRFLAIAAILTIVVTLFSACESNSPNRGATPTPVPTLVKYEPSIFTVERGGLVSQKSVIGEIVPANQDNLVFHTDGMVSRLVVKTGDMVKKGDLLAELQVDDVLNQLQQARIDLDVAQSALDKAKNDGQYAAQKAQIDVNVAQDRLDMARLDYINSYGLAKKRAEINLKIAEENLKTAQLNLQQIGATTSSKEEQVVERQKLAVTRLESLLADRQIIAPYDGVILRVTFTAGKQITAFSPAIDIGEPTDLVIRASPDTNLEGLIDRNTEVQFSFNGSSDQIHPVNYLPDFEPFSTIMADNQQIFTQDWMYFSAPTDVPKDQLKIGAKVNLNVIIGRRENVLLLPPAAIRNYRGLNFVIVQKGDRRQRVEITKIGLQTDDRWEIEGDLQEGDLVVGP